MQIELKIDTSDNSLAFALLSPAHSLSPGTATKLPRNGSLMLREMSFRKAFGAHETLALVLTTGKDIVVAVLASGLYDRLRDRARSLRVGDREVEIREETIRMAITEAIDEQDASCS